MREKKYHIYLTAEEQSRVIQSLIRLKNELLEQGRYTDAVDDVLCKVCLMILILRITQRKFSLCSQVRKFLWIYGVITA